MASFAYTVSKVIYGPGLPNLQILSGNQLRLAIVFQIASLQQCFIGNVPQDSQLYGQFQLSRLDPFWVTRKDFGPLVQDTWYITGSAGVGVMIVTEVFTVPGSY